MCYYWHWDALWCKSCVCLKNRIVKYQLFIGLLWNLRFALSQKKWNIFAERATFVKYFSQYIIFNPFFKRNKFKIVWIVSLLVRMTKPVSRIYVTRPRWSKRNMDHLLCIFVLIRLVVILETPRWQAFSIFDLKCSSY